MSNTAPEFKITDPVDVEGLDELYEVGSAMDRKAKPEGSAESEEAQPEGLAGMYTVEETAKRLDISKNAVQKRIARGKLKAKKVSGKYGKVWMIDLSDESEVLHVEVENSDSDICDEVHKEDIEEGSAENEEAQPKGSANTEEPKPGGSAGDKKAQPEGSANSKIEIAWQMELLNRVERLSQENGQLKALLEEREKEIKLLTDSENQPTGWNKFMKWFIGG